MRRFIVCLLLCLLPLQWSWALVHDAAHGVEASASQSVHVHGAGVSGHDHGLSQSGLDEASLSHTPDCDACTSHCAHTHLVALAPEGSVCQSAEPQAERHSAAQIAPPLGTFQRIERPKWLSTAPSRQ